eukprot:12101377-Ditylum_brightwellii.AAC.1
MSAPQHQSAASQVYAHLAKYWPPKKQFDKNAVAECPLCQSAEETWTHLFQCQYKDAIAIQMLALTTFKQELLKLGTTPIVKQAIHYNIMQWCSMPTSSAPRIANSKIDEAICRAIEDQHCIGWDNFMK